MILNFFNLMRYFTLNRVYFSFTRTTLRFVSGFNLHRMPTGVSKEECIYLVYLFNSFVQPCCFAYILGLLALSSTKRPKENIERF